MSLEELTTSEREPSPERVTFTLSIAEANAPRPERPIGLRGLLDYYDDLACWKATQAERFLSGVAE